MALYLKLPTSVRARLDLLLFSELEGRVPKGAYQEFFLARIRDFFDSREVDLAPFIIGSEPGMLKVRGSPETLQRLLRRLEVLA